MSSAPEQDDEPFPGDDFLEGRHRAYQTLASRSRTISAEECFNREYEAVITAFSRIAPDSLYLSDAESLLAVISTISYSEMDPLAQGLTVARESCKTVLDLTLGMLSLQPHKIRNEHTRPIEQWMTEHCEREPEPRSLRYLNGDDFGLIIICTC